tara:strand:- start:1884 stop:4244 length:2361 start_codon:yes stop_codon:yes gene_type:complete
MAKFENMTLSYTQIASIPFQTRKAASGSLLDALSRELTPGQRVALFPSYVNQIYASGGVKDGDKAPPAEGWGEGPPPSVDATVEKAGPPRPGKGLTTTREIIPGGLIPDPVTGKPMRVPDQQKLASLKDVGDGQDLPLKTRMAVVQKSIEEQLKKDGYNAKDIKKVAAAFTGQVMAESSFDPNALHDKDKSGNPTGYGIYGARLTRRDAMLEWLAKEGYEKNSLVGQARFMAHEAVTVPEYSKLMKDLSEMTDIGDMTLQVGKRFEKPLDINASIETRRNAAEEAATLDLSGLDEEGNYSPLDNVYDMNEDEIKEATAEPIKKTASGAAGIVAPIDDPLAYLNDRNPDKAKLDKVDPALLKSVAEGIQQYELLHPEHKVEIFGPSSGHRGSGSTGNHGTQRDGYGAAIDTVIIDRETGSELKNHGKRDYSGQVGEIGETSPYYLRLHGMMQLANLKYNPDDSQLRTGVGFVSGADGMDAMHIDQQRNVGMAGYSWEEGLTRDQMNRLGTSTNVKLGDKKTAKATASNLFATDDAGNYINRPATLASSDGRTETLSWAENATESATYVRPQQIVPIGEENDYALQLPDGTLLPVSSKDASPEEQAKVIADHKAKLAAETATPVAATPEPPKTATYTMGELTGTGKTPPGYNAAAGGTEITDPSMIISEDGKKVTRVAETGPEKLSVMPRHKSSDVFQENQVLMQEARQEKDREEAAKPDIATIKSSQPMSDFGRSRETGQSIAISTVMPRITPSTNKAFADAKMVGRFNKADIDGDMGIVYIDRGYA